MQIRICFDTQHMFVMLMHTILCNTSNNGSSREISFTRDKTGVKPSTLERSLHRQCVRRCISVDHRWIIFHLITRQLLRADESQGIKNLIPHKIFMIKHICPGKKKSRGSEIRLSNSIDENRAAMGKSMTEEVGSNGGHRADCVKKSPPTKFPKEIVFESRACRRHYQVGTEQ